MAAFSEFEYPKVLFRKTLSIFINNNNFYSFWEIILIPLHSTANVLQFGEKKYTLRNMNKKWFSSVKDLINKQRSNLRTPFKKLFRFFIWNWKIDRPWLPDGAIGTDFL